MGGWNVKFTLPLGRTSAHRMRAPFTAGGARTTMVNVLKLTAGDGQKLSNTFNTKLYVLDKFTQPKFLGK